MLFLSPFLQLQRTFQSFFLLLFFFILDFGKPLVYLYEGFPKLSPGTPVGEWGIRHSDLEGELFEPTIFTIVC